LVIIFEPTGIYSSYLKEFCAENSIKAYIVNPQKSHNFTRALGRRSKTDKIDACTLYQFHKLIEAKDIQIPKIDQEAKILSSYLTSYEFALKQRISLSHHLESLRDKRLITLLEACENIDFAGVGFYEKKNFLHLDVKPTKRIRWRECF